MFSKLLLKAEHALKLLEMFDYSICAVEAVLLIIRYFRCQLHLYV